MKQELKLLNKQIKDYEKILNPLYKARSKIQNKISLKENLKAVGKCFKYRNTYGGDNKWWLYIKIVSASSWNLDTLEIQDDHEGRIEIIKSDFSSNSLIRNKNYIEVPSEEFDKQFEKILKKIK